MSHSINIKTRLDPRLATRIKDKKNELDRHRPLSEPIVKRLVGDLRLVLTYHSNAIEGNTLTLQETAAVLEYGITLGQGHTLREYQEATNHAQALDYLFDFTQKRTKLSLDAILTLHGLVMHDIDPTAGQLRRSQVYIRGARFTPPPPHEVRAYVEEWVGGIESLKDRYEPVVAAAIAHRDFEAIHPFLDGNGRTGRLLLNILLMRAGFPPALVLREWRGNYIKALAAADSGNYSPIINIVGRAVEGGLNMYLEAVQERADEDYKPLSELAKETGLSADYLGWLARHGRLAAVKRSARWYSTKAAVAQYQKEVAESLVPGGRPSS